MQLYLCEKPSQGADLAKVLGVNGRYDGYIGQGDVRVTWCIGHLLELFSPDDYCPEWKRWDLKLLPVFPETWRYQVKSGTKKQFNVVKSLLAKTNLVYVSSDGDREGETLAREVLDMCHYRGEIQRLWLTALDPKSIQKALNNIKPGSQTEALYWAGMGRMRADWLVGMNLTRLFTKVVNAQRPLTVGRVQTPTLKLVVDRDREIEHFVAKDYFELVAEFQVAQGVFKAKWQAPEEHADEAGHCLNKQVVAHVQAAVDGQTGRIIKADTKRKKQKPPPLFSLSSLQQMASRFYGFSADKTLKIAQSLYEKHKAATYPRTDSNFLPVEQHNEVPGVLQAIAQTDVSVKKAVEQANPALKGACFNTSKVTAHHAIIPTATPADLHKMSLDELKLYRQIRDRYIMQFYPDYEYDETLLVVDVKGHRFGVTGRIPRKMGWKVLQNEKANKEEEDDKADKILKLPAVKVNEPAKVNRTELKSLKTKPPARFTEGTLIAAMKYVARYVEDSRLKKILKENAGIGTESTRAAIIKNLIDRDLISQNKKHLISTETGRYLISLLPDSITNPATTALWEQKLDEIEKRQGNLDQFIQEQQQFINTIINEVKQNAAQYQLKTKPAQVQQAKRTTESVVDASSIPCPTCQQPLRRIKGSSGFFWGCSGYPQCKTTLEDKRGKPVLQTTVYDCPECSHPLMRRKGSNGFFWGCRQYPDCHFTAPDQRGKPVLSKDKPSIAKPSNKQKTQQTSFSKETVSKEIVSKEIVSKEVDSKTVVSKAAPQCPKCQNTMVKRKGKFGEFWGCSGFPQCKTILNRV